MWIEPQRAAPMRRPGIPPRLVIAGVIALISLISYYAKSTFNPVTGRTQRISLSPEQEIALGLQSAPEMVAQMGGLSTNRDAANLVRRVGGRLLEFLPPDTYRYPFDFHLLADRQTVNAFALPGGQVFITEALLSRLETEGQLAGVLGHEIGHVLARHSAERMAKAQLTQGLVGAAATAGGDQQSQAIASMVGNFMLMKYGRGDELESDQLGVAFMARAGYDPRSLVGVMKILREASGGSSRPEFMSTHPAPENRMEAIEQAIARQFPGGLPPNLVP